MERVWQGQESLYSTAHSIVTFQNELRYTNDTPNEHFLLPNSISLFFIPFDSLSKSTAEPQFDLSALGLSLSLQSLKPRSLLFQLAPY